MLHLKLLLLLLRRTLEKGGQFVLLGSGHCEGDFKALANGDFKDSKDCR